MRWAACAYSVHMAASRRRSRKRTNLSLRVDLVKRAKRLELNLSEVVETALEAAIQDRERSAWLSENQQAIRDYNAFVEKHGVFGDHLRQF